VTINVDVNSLMRIQFSFMLSVMNITSLITPLLCFYFWFSFHIIMCT